MGIHRELISLPLSEAENLLKSKGENYIVKRVGSFNRKPPVTDTEAVIGVKKENAVTVLYVCGFMCGIYNKGSDNERTEN